jgi:hypothetical protein
MTMDPSNGEISRAMRNRCVEICLLSTTSSSTTTTTIIDNDWRVTSTRILASRECHGQTAQHAATLHHQLMLSGARVQWRQLARLADTLRATSVAASLHAHDRWRLAFDAVYIAAATNRSQCIVVRADCLLLM